MFRNKYDLCVAPNKYRLWIACPVKPPTTTTSTTSTSTTSTSTTSTTTTEWVPCFGLLYNWYAATDARNIAAAGWHVPTNNNYVTLMQYIDPMGTGGNNIAGGKLKEIGFIYWETPNTDATNEYGFNLRGGGRRAFNTGTFAQFMREAHLMTSTPHNVTYADHCATGFSIDDFYVSLGAYGLLSNHKDGNSIRLIKDSTSLTHGQTGTYTGNDGKVYNTICIGTQEWVSCNIEETRYRNGDAIPEVTGNAAWAALSTGALCAYNNDWGYTCH